LPRGARRITNSSGFGSHAPLKGQQDEVGATTNAELVQQVRDVELYGAFGDIELAGNLLVGEILEE
jgi:hypothetical protein